MYNVPQDGIDAQPPKLLDHAVRKAFESLAMGLVVNPPRQETLGREGDPDYFRLAMPATLLGDRGAPLVEAIKVIEEAGATDESGQRRLGERTARLELHHVPSGQRVVLPADALTDRRTAAAAVWSLRWLVGDLQRLAIIGTGRVAAEVALAADRLLSCEVIRAASRTAERCAAFESRLASKVSGELSAQPDVDWALDGAHAVIAAVPSPVPMLTAARIAPVRAAVAVEGDPRSVLLDADVVAAGPLVVDQVAQAAESGSLQRGGAVGYAMVDGRAATVADAAAGRLAHLRDSRPVVLLTGLAALDLMVGWAIWQALGGPAQNGT